MTYNNNEINYLENSITKDIQRQKDHENLNPTEDNLLVIQSNKIPHPPPQSTRPTSTPARKLRLSSAVKNNQHKQSAISVQTKARMLK